MTNIAKDFLYTTIGAYTVPLSQFYRKSDGTPQILEGEKAPYFQLVDINGVPFFTKENPASVSLADSNVIQPVDIQSRLQKTIQTHNAVSVSGTNGQSLSSWIDCDGFDKIALSLLNDVGTNSFVHIYWSNDGTNEHGWDLSILPTDTQQKRVVLTDIKARYAKVVLNNGDTIAHTMSAWAYLKA